MPELSAVFSDKLVREFLDAVEREEAKLLSWGVVDGGFSHDELLEHAERFIAEHEDGNGADAGQLVEELLRRHLAIDLPDSGGRVFRTRTAESVRLFARLRQMFQFGHWRTGATLVSDFRFAMQTRVYPRRDVPVEQALQQLRDAGVLSAPRQAALEALLARGEFQLSGFQVRATERVLRDLDGSWNRGMIVTVGTGSGKTLAFYLPVLASIASVIKRGPAWTKAIAMYPRNELLKDQFSDTYAEARRLDALLLAQGRRQLTIGAYFGPTPANAKASDVEARKWDKFARGYVCPYLRCPKCRGELAWLNEHLARGVERLDCSSCGVVVSDSEVYLTRSRMQQSPPDVLFTTTEMLNRAMGDAKARHVFGIGAISAPQVMLLDEVHTYVGTHGAQVAMLLRRWRHAVGRRVQFSGLSATLRNATDFFSQLTGLPANAIEEVAPAQGELEAEGMEYMLVLRGDPVSKTSLLSTTIQSAMLLRRILDPRTSDDTGIHGKKVFAFTDDLDVTNRLYHNLLDAEGVDYLNRPRPGRVPLASLRARGLSDSLRRLRAGQSWHLCEEIGHPEGLGVPLVIGRTSSQDTGVNRQADVIVATASLEVGYNDSEVGAVIQHKAPRDAAAFVQRKGRAGRLRKMRPWTVVVLSDYGRDRIAYQGYEALFDPVLSPRVLPITNRYVLRIQAVFAFMDWLALQMAAEPKGSVYMDFTGPAPWAAAASRQRAEAKVVRRLLAGEASLQSSLERYITQALCISADEVTSLLWEPPRSLMLQALPTLLRRLESGWHRVALHPGEIERDYVVANAPLPDFLSQSLFTDLNLPEVTVTTVVHPRGRATTDHALPIGQALRTLVPGKVTRRFAVNRSTVSHWIPISSVDPTATRQTVAVEDVCTEFEELGEFEVAAEDGSERMRCVRPWSVSPSIVPQNVNATSNAWPEWRSQFVADGSGIELDLPANSPWSAHVREIRLHSHAYRSGVEVRRFTIGARASVRLRGPHGTELQAQIRYITRETGRPAAIGSVAHVDGLRFRVELPTDMIVRADEANVEKLRAYRTAYFRHRVLTDEALSALTTVFQREWLYQVYLSVLTAWSIAESTSLQLANVAMQPLIKAASEKVLGVIFEALAAEDDGEDASGEEDDRASRLKGDVTALLDNAEVISRLRQLAAVLWEPPDSRWQAWGTQRYLATVGCALLEACRQLYPEAGGNDLLLDVDPGVRPSGQLPIPDGMADLWITESAIGGGGVVEEVGRRYVEDPRRFFRLVENALAPSDREVVDAELTRLLATASNDAETATALDRVRHASRHDELQTAIRVLETLLGSKGVLVSRSFMSAVHARITRPGSSRATDELLLNLIRRWHDCEERLGIEVDARVYAYLESDREEVITALTMVDVDAAKDRTFRFHAIYGLLWPRGNTIRSLALEAYNPYATLQPTDRELVTDRVAYQAPSVSVSDLQWRAHVSETLRMHGTVRLVAEAQQHEELGAALLALGSEPLEIDFLHVYPRVDGVARTVDGLSATIVLAEAVQ